MIGPAVTVHMNYVLRSCFFLHQSLTASNCCLISAGCAFHLLWLYHWGDDLFWFDGSLFFGLALGLITALGLTGFLGCLFFGLFDLLFFNWGFLRDSRSVLADRFFDHWFLSLLGCFLLNLGYSFLLDRGFGFKNWRLYFLSGPNFLHWWFSFSHRWLESPFILETLDNFFQCESWFFKINFKLNSILIWDLNFFFKPVLSFVLEVSNVRSGIDINTPQIILLTGLFLIKLERECGFSIGVEVGYVKI
jgi:hypothetical protein